jgi:tRNA wybutosine-synthesizing protein 4
VNHQRTTYVVGGVAKDTLLQAQDEIFSFSSQSDRSLTSMTKVSPKWDLSRPLLIGSSVVSTGASLLILGGSAVCFSFGTAWNNAVYSISTGDAITASREGSWVYTHTVDPRPSVSQSKASERTSQFPAELTRVRRLRFGDSDDFPSLLQAGVPVVLEGLNLGVCTREWTPQGLKAKIGSDREVGVTPYVPSNADLAGRCSRKYG